MNWLESHVPEDTNAAFADTLASAVGSPGDRPIAQRLDKMECGVFKVERCGGVRGHGGW